MKKGNAATEGSAAALGTISTTTLASPASPSIVPSAPGLRQKKSAVEITHIGAIWKSPRDKRTCIQAGLKSFNGSPYCDLRIFEMDAQGRMRATAKGVTISAQKLMQLAKLVGDAARKAQALGLTAVSS